jgi:asparagine synthase (glutamine-hydrolysing)
MCGVFGILSFDAPVSQEALRAGMQALRHRGPDGERQWLAPDGRVGLAHTRLSIIDLTTGAQPIASEDGRVRVVVNGELYGFEVIRAALERKGHRFSTQSDAEIVVHLYEEYGTSCLDHLRGEFAFVLWDQARHRLFAARDRFGIKPLFYARTNDGLHLASEAKALFASGVPAVWNEEVVFQAAFACLNPAESLFRGVQQVPPGHYLTATGTAVDLHRYWDADYPAAPSAGAHAPHPRECVDRVRALIDEAVRLRMRADVRVGCLLSGGLDSSAVLGMAARYAAGPMAAFTITFDDPDYDESSAAREAAAFSGADLTEVPATRARLAERFEDSVYHGEILQYNAHGTARFLLSRAVSQSGYKTVLAGEGADELFAGYGFSRAAVLGPRAGGALRRRLRQLWKMAQPRSPVQQSIARTSPWLERASRAIDLPDELLTSLAQRMTVLRSVLASDFADRQRRRDPYRDLYESLNPAPRLRGREPAKQLIYLWLKTVFPGYVLTADRADMAHGVEVRLPFLDHILFDHLRTIPVATLAHGGEIKHLLREAASPFLAPATRHRLKKPLMAPPFSEQPGHPLLGVVQDLLRSQRARAQPFFDVDALLRTLDARVAHGGKGQASLDPLLMMTASLCVLGERLRISSA